MEGFLLSKMAGPPVTTARCLRACRERRAYSALKSWADARFVHPVFDCAASPSHVNLVNFASGGLQPPCLPAPSSSRSSQAGNSISRIRRTASSTVSRRLQIANRSRGRSGSVPESSGK